MATLFQDPSTAPVSAGNSFAGAKRHFYQAGTTTNITTYTTSALSVAHANPVVADANGVFAPIYINEAVNTSYRMQLKTSADVLLRDIDNIPALSVLSQSSIGALLNPQTAAELAAGVTPSNFSSDTTDYSEVRRYGYLADDATDNSAALANALLVQANGGPVIRLPPGIGRFSTSLNIPTKGGIVGSGKERTTLKYSGAAQAFKQATPSTRIYELHLSDFSLYDIGTGTVGLDLESISTSDFERLWIDGFTTGVRIHSPTSGFAVYNRFYDVTTNSGATTKGFVLSGTSSNAHLFVGCRANFNSQTATRGWEITDGNGNQIIGCHPEGGDVGIYITATGPALAGGNIVAFNRLEGWVTAINIASANVEDNRIVQNHYTINTTNISDSGTRTHIDEVGARSGTNFPSTVAANANGTLRYVRGADGGASLPFVVFRDEVTGSGTPVTVQAETERVTGTFFRGRRGGVTYFEAFANGIVGSANKMYPGTDAGATQVVAGIFAGNGVPNNANGNNGDFYLRGDGTQAGNTVMYHKEGGAWVALVSA